ncbi:major facilitator superfamily domain-containing protein [Sparassis latifolia]|uniref:Major facilitator superfamily (MFS) profile domain-containing protein n=1 Tax=Sparassis crispa TaxID=139825 RepID=A0A401GFF7_9APHY|nr:hypothetical protein SCP_0306400 [Sparassis crispa]GBE80918.1 hypothetical protein SCP_0306400 [Sparassis crispa]
MEASPGAVAISPLPLRKISNARRYTLFVVFCLAMFLDAFNLSALFAATPVLESHFNMDESQASWVISAFQLTYASFLLISGRISDVYHPKPAFVLGVSCLGLLSLGTGFVKDKIGLIILRALCGICAAMTIPSALALIVRFFPEPREQSRAIGIFGGVGGVGNTSGAIISALFVDFANFHWIFYFVTILAVPSAVACIVLIPPQDKSESDNLTAKEKLRNLDLVGVGVLTAALILFIFAVTSGSDAGWSSAEVLAPLIISVFMVAGFFFWETRLPPERAAIPPATWFLPNLTVLFGVSLLPYFWWNTAIMTFYGLWQKVYGWSVIKAAVHMIPIGVTSLLVSFTGPIARYIPRKWIILFGHVIAIAATILFVFADGPDKYWRFVFPGLTIGSAGAMLIYTHTSIAIFETTPATMAGIAGALFNCGIELGAAVGLAADTSIESSVEKSHGGFYEFYGRRATFWWQVATLGVSALAVLVFYRADAKAPPPSEAEREYVARSSTEKRGVESEVATSVMSPERTPVESGRSTAFEDEKGS